MSTHLRRVDVAFTENADHTRADAILAVADQRFHGFGQAKRSSEDPSIPVIGEELGAARAHHPICHIN